MFQLTLSTWLKYPLELASLLKVSWLFAALPFSCGLLFIVPDPDDKHPFGKGAVIVYDEDDVATIVLCSKLCLFFRSRFEQEMFSFLLLLDPTVVTALE